MNACIQIGAPLRSMVSYLVVERYVYKKLKMLSAYLMRLGHPLQVHVHVLACITYTYSFSVLTGCEKKTARALRSR